MAIVFEALDYVQIIIETCKSQGIFEDFVQKRATLKDENGANLPAEYKWLAYASSVHLAAKYHPESLDCLLVSILDRNLTTVQDCCPEGASQTPLHIAASRYFAKLFD